MNNSSSLSLWKASAFSIAGTFITYFSMYAFRKPFTAAIYEDLSLWGIDYKILLIISQVLGYTCSKFLGIKIVSEMKAGKRIIYILGLIGFSWVALLLFGLTPYPYNFIFLFFNGLPLGMIWGIVFSFIEGKRQTEFLAAAMASSFIVSSGVVKSVGRWLVLNGASEFWMPFLSGLLFIPTLFLGVWFLSRIPSPTEKDESARTKRVPMEKEDRKHFFNTFTMGIFMITFLYMALNAYRDFRDNFAVEIWNSLGFADQPEILTFAELPIAILVLVISGLLVYVKNNRTAFYSNLGIISLGGFLVLGTTFLFLRQAISPAFWMISMGFGMYLAYISYHTVLLERWIALFKHKSNIGYLMYICDAFGYLTSVGVLLYKNFGARELSWLEFFISISFVMGFVALILPFIAWIYFRMKEKQLLQEPSPGITATL